MPMDVRPYAGWLFDLDGTIHLGDELLPGASDLIGALVERGIPHRFVSNNPTRSRDDVVATLRGFGLPVDEDDVVTSVMTTVDWLARERPGSVVFPIAEAPVVEALAAAGIPMSDDPARIDIVLASFDRTFDYRKLQIAFDALWFHRRAIVVQTNPDRYCPYAGGRGEPDCAAITAAIEASTGVRCEQSFGKPSPLIAERAMRGWHVAPADVLMVGDRIATDIALARAAGLASALVLTGDSTEDDIAALPPDRRPTHVVHGLDELARFADN